MTTISTLSVELNGKDVNVDAMLARIDASLLRTDATAKRTTSTFGTTLPSSMQRSTSGALALQSAQARLEAQQGNLAGAAGRLQNALAQQTTTTTQTIAAERQLLTVQAQLAGGTSALGAGFQQIGGAIGGLPGQLLSVGTGIGAVTAAIGAGVSVVTSFAHAFSFKATLDANASSLKSALEGYRNVGATLDEAAAFGRQYNITQEQTNSILTSSIDVLKQSSGSVTELETALLRLGTRDVSKPISEAARAVRELQAGDVTSIKELFNVPAKDALAMKTAIAGGADSIQVLTAWLDKAGVGMNALAQRTDGALGKMHELEVAQEDLTLAQAAFAQGPGLALLQERITLTSGVTRVLTGDFAAMGASLQATLAGSSAYNTVLAQGGTIAAAAAAQSAAYAASLAATAATTQVATLATAQNTDATKDDITTEAAAAAAIRATAAAESDKATASQVATLASQTLALSQASLTAAAQTAANVILAGGGNIAATAARLAGSASQVEILTAAYLRLAAAQATATGVKLQQQTARQLTGADSEQAGIRANQRAAVAQDRAQRVKASSDAARAEESYQLTLKNTAPALAHARAELAQLTVGSAAYINKQNDIAKLQQQTEKNAKASAGGGGPKLTAQEKLNNALLTNQETFDTKAEDAERDHVDRIVAINEEFAKRMREAQDRLGQSQLDSRAGFYDSLGSIEDAGLRNALAAQYEAAFQEADQIAKDKGADVGQKFLEARQSAIEAQGKRASEIAQATKEGDKDKAAYLAGVDKLYRAAEERRVAAIAAGADSATAQRDAQLAEEGAKYADAQDQIGAKADQAAERKILASQRSGQAVDAEGLKVDTLTKKYDGLGAAGARAGITPAATAQATATGEQAAPTAAPAGAADPIASAIASLKDAIGAVERATRDAGRGVESAVRSIPRSVA